MMVGTTRSQASQDSDSASGEKTPLATASAEGTEESGTLSSGDGRFHTFTRWTGGNDLLCGVGSAVVITIGCLVPELAACWHVGAGAAGGWGSTRAVGLFDGRKQFGRQLEHLRETVNQVTRERDRLTANLGKAEKLSRRLTGQNKKLEASLAAFQEKQGAATDRLGEEVDGLVPLVQIMEQTLGGLQKTLTAAGYLGSAVAEAGDKTEALSDQIDSADGVVGELRVHADSQAGALQRLDLLLKDFATAAGEVKGVTRDLRRQTRAVKRLNGEIEKTTGKLEVKRKAIAALKAESGTATAEIRAQLEELQGEMDSYRAQAQAAERLTGDLKETVKLLFGLAEFPSEPLRGQVQGRLGELGITIDDSEDEESDG